MVGEPKTDGGVYNVGSGTPTRFVDMAQMVVDVVGQGEVALVPWPDTYPNVETGDFWADISRIRTDTQWRPTTTLRQGIEGTAAYYRDHRDQYW